MAAQIRFDKLDLKAKLLLALSLCRTVFSVYLFITFFFLVLVGTGTTKKGSAQVQTINSGSTVWRIFWFKAELFLFGFAALRGKKPL